MSTMPSNLRDALEHRTSKQPLVDWVFSRVAERYDLGNDIMSLGWHTRWKRQMVARVGVKSTDRVLDIACGTGDTTFMIGRANPDGETVGTDINNEMLRLAEAKRPPDTAHITFAICDAMKLPFEDESFDIVTCTYAGRGFPDWDAVLSEAHRVLKPGGTFWNLDFGRPPNPVIDWGYRTWMTVSGAFLGIALHGHPKTYIYIPESVRAYPGQRWLKERMEAVGFEAMVDDAFLGIMAFNSGIKR